MAGAHSGIESTVPHPGKEAIIVIGMHRSGTSAVTGSLQCLGVQLGKKLYAGHSGINAKGYFEHSAIADANEEVLLSIGSAWDDVLPKIGDWWEQEQLRPYFAKVQRYIRRDFSDSSLWAIKDPRICRILPFWLKIFSVEGIEPRFLFVVRSPDAVYRSLERRDGFSKDKSFMLWVLHYLEAEYGTRGYPRAFTMFDRMLDDPAGEFLRIEKQLKLSFPVSPSSAADLLGRFLSSDLSHHKASDVHLQSTPISELAYELEERLTQAALSMDSVQHEICTDDLWREMEYIQKEFSPVLVEQLRSLGQRRGQVELTIHRLMRSWSWYIGKPVRYFERMFGRDV